jgi:hypothetical protein
MNLSVEQLNILGEALDVVRELNEDREFYNEQEDSNETHLLENTLVFLDKITT